MAKRISQSLLWLAAAALAERVVIEDFAGPVDAFFLDDGSAAGLPSSGDSALEKADDGLRLNYDVARNGPFGAALLGKVWGGYRDLSNASRIRLTYRIDRRRNQFNCVRRARGRRARVEIIGLSSRRRRRAPEV